MGDDPGDVGTAGDEAGETLVMVKAGCGSDEREQQRPGRKAPENTRPLHAG